MDRPEPLLRLKVLIWIHSVIGAALAMGFFAAVVTGRPDSIIGGVVFSGILWCIGLAPLSKKAKALDLPDRKSSPGLPDEVLAVWFLAELLSLCLWWVRDEGAYLFLAHLFAGITVLLRGFISFAFDVPIGRRTWGVSLTILLIGAIGYLFGAFLVACASC